MIHVGVMQDTLVNNLSSLPSLQALQLESAPKEDTKRSDQMKMEKLRFGLRKWIY